MWGWHIYNIIQDRKLRGGKLIKSHMYINRNRRPLTTLRGATLWHPAYLDGEEWGWGREGVAPATSNFPYEKKKKRQIKNTGEKLWWSLWTLCLHARPGESYCKRHRSLLLCLCDVYGALINSLVCWYWRERIQPKTLERKGEKKKKSQHWREL